MPLRMAAKLWRKSTPPLSKTALTAARSCSSMSSNPGMKSPCGECSIFGRERRGHFLENASRVVSAEWDGIEIKGSLQFADVHHEPIQVGTLELKGLKTAGNIQAAAQGEHPLGQRLAGGDGVGDRRRTGNAVIQGFVSSVPAGDVVGHDVGQEYRARQSVGN